MKKLLSTIFILLLLTTSMAYAGAYKTDKATGAANIAYSLKPDTDEWQLVSMRIHLSAAGGANNLTITLNAGAGAAYDVNLVTLDMTAVTDYEIRFDPAVPLQKTDQIDIAWTNGSTRTYGMEVIYK